MEEKILSRGTEAGEGVFLAKRQGKKLLAKLPGGTGGEKEGKENRGTGKVGTIVDISLCGTIWKIGQIPRDGRLHPCFFPPLVSRFQGNMRNIEPTSL